MIDGGGEEAEQEKDKLAVLPNFRILNFLVLKHI